MSAIRRSVLVAAALLAASARIASAASDKPTVMELVANPRAGGLEVSYRVESAFTEESTERLLSGIEVEFRHRVEVVVRRALPLWPARVVARADVTVLVRYDSLTRQYYLTRTIERERDGKRVPGNEAPVESSTSSREEAERFMAALDVSLALPPPKEGERERRLRVRSWLGRRYRFYLFPMADSAEDELDLPSPVAAP